MEKILADINEQRFLNWEEDMMLLPPYRINKINKHKMLADKKRSFVAGMLLHEKLAEIGYVNADFHIQEVDFGKQVLPHYTGLDFSISHSVDKVLLVIHNKHVGCDIEFIEQYHPDLAHRFFSNEECSMIENSEDKDTMFYKIWTLKEAYLKMKRIGLKNGLKNCEVIENNGVLRVKDAENVEFFVFEEPEYIYSIALEK